MQPKDQEQQSVQSDGVASSSDELLARARRAKATRLAQRGIAVSAMALAGAQGLNCGVDDESATADDTEIAAPNVPRPGQDNSGKQFEGERNTEMVYYDGGFWIEQSNCNTRMGCMDVDMILKVFVKPAPNANLDAKKIGVMFRVPSWQDGRSEVAYGSYFATNGGIEEWHVRIRLHPWMDSPMALVFSAFYRDGAGRTFYDDNAGEFHVAVKDYYGIVRQVWYTDAETTALQIDSAGIQGQIAIQLSDLDYDKQIELVWTADGWATSNTFGIGGATNQWQWVRDYYSGYEIWRLPVDIDQANVTAFEYAIVYKHGVVNGATPYEFWDNNGGGNYVVQP